MGNGNQYCPVCVPGENKELRVTVPVIHNVCIHVLGVNQDLLRLAAEARQSIKLHHGRAEILAVRGILRVGELSPVYVLVGQ